MTHFKSLSKQTKFEQFFKCLKCSLRAAKSLGIEHQQLLDLIHKDSTTQTEIKNNSKSSDKDSETVTPLETSRSVTLDNSEEKLLESKAAIENMFRSRPENLKKSTGRSVGIYYCRVFQIWKNCDQTCTTKACIVRHLYIF